MRPGMLYRGRDGSVGSRERPLFQPLGQPQFEFVFAIYAGCLQATTLLASASYAARRLRTA